MTYSYFSPPPLFLSLSFEGRRAKGEGEKDLYNLLDKL